MRKTVVPFVAAAMLLGLPNAGAKAPKPLVVFEDPAGDADNAQGTGQSVPGGFDLTGGTIALSGKDLVFTVTHADMPPNGSAPEGFRFLWHINVDGREYRFTVKSFDIGKPDAVAQSGTERVGRVDANGHFRLEECVIESTPAIQLSNCNALAYLEGKFDPATKSFTFNVPLDAIEAKAGSVIAPGTGGASGTGCQICWVPHYAERSLTPVTIIDAASQTVPFKVPKK